MTPAPWTISNNAIYGSSGLIKPLIAYLDDRFVDEEAANNARLIAAAPDLLAALQAILHDTTHDLVGLPRDEALELIFTVADTAHAAITKATGEQA